MSSKQEVKRRRPVRWRLWLIFALILGAILIFMFGGDGLWHSLFLRQRVSGMEARIDSLSRTGELMQKRIQGLEKSDEQTLEEEARSHGMIKPGEKVYILKPKSEKGKVQRGKTDR